MTTSTRIRRIGFVATLVVAVAACSTNGSSAPTSAVVTTTIAPGTPLPPLQQRVYDLTRSSALAQGVALDERCLTTITSQFSDADAQLIVDATPTGDTPTLSAQGTALTKSVPTCIIPASSTSTTTGTATG